MTFVRDFNTINKSDVSIAGGKGASLGEMTQADFPIPGGFVVLASAIETFLATTDLNVEIDAILDTVKHEQISTIEIASEKIQALILRAKMPREVADEIKKSFKKLNTTSVAVRSSATAEDSASAAWAGQLDTFLNTTEDKLLENTQRCWASLFTPRAIFYRFEKGMHGQHISVAVVIQKMVKSEKSGIAFSVHPVTEDQNQLIIEAGFGLGEAIVSGRITPDSYVVEKTPRRIIDVNINQPSQVLSDEQILELSKLIIRAEDHYSFPCDIEWAYEAGRFFITQSRPITTLNRVAHSKNLNETIRELTKSTTRERTLFYVNIWFESDKETYAKWANLELSGSLFIGEGKTQKISAWYDQKLVDKFSAEVARRAKSEAAYISQVFKAYDACVGRLEAFMTGSRTIASPSDLHDYYRAFVDWWLPMSVLLELPDIHGLPQSVLDKALSLREETEAWAEKADALYLSFMSEAFPSLGDIASVMMPEELFDLQDGQLSEATHERISRRLSGYCLVDGVLYEKDQLQQSLRDRRYVLEEEDTTGVTEIKGSIGNPGNAIGSVRIIRYRGELGFFQEGEILVSEMTTPDFLPAVKKAAGIVTDEGGITCHAAIVARELGKPCIIGTKIATQFLKGGDRVEVDADHGVVRILERQNRFQKADYLLSFWVRGVSVFVTDIHKNAYADLEVLYIIDHGMFKQYFTRKAYEQALDRGLSFYSDSDAFNEYRKDLSSHCEKFKEFFGAGVKNRKTLSRETVGAFFEYTKKLCGDYAKMNFEFTDKAFAHQDEHPTIEKNLASIAQFKDSVRAFMNTVLFEPDGYSSQCFAILGKQFDLRPAVLDNLTQREILELFEGKRPNESIVEKRQEAFVESYDLEGFYEGKDAEGILREFEEAVEYSDTISGEVASKGKVTGVVKIIPVDYSDPNRVNTEIEKMRQGDILVAETTAPELIVACKKAGAIVTDMGGLMSHAAIVSREFEIPCVVGTKNASKILKDGDVVEVDADRGVIRILNN